jgi:Glycosyltransferase family 87
MQRTDNTGAAVRWPEGRHLISRTVVGVCALYYVYFNVLRVLPAMPLPSDFDVYYTAGRAVLTHQSPFHDARYLYPSLFAFLIAPISPLSYVGARSLWFVLSHACLLASAYMLWRYAGRKSHALWCIAIVWTFGGAANESLALGQIGPLLLLLLVLTLPRSPGIRGVAAGVGAALKYIPALVAAPLILARDWRALRWLVASASALLVIPWLILVASFPGPYAPANAGFWMGTPAILSWSVPSCLLRLVERPVRGLPANWLYGNDLANIHLPAGERILSLCASGCVIALGIVILALACRGRLGGSQIGWAVFGMISVAVTAAPISWTHYQVLNYPGVALLLARSVERRSWKVFSAGLLCFAFMYQVPILILRERYEAAGGWAAMPAATIYVWSSISAVVGLFLFALFIVVVRAERQAGKMPNHEASAVAP